MKLFAVMAALALSVTVTDQAEAATLIDTGEPTGPGGYNIFNYGPTAYQYLAVQFTLTGTTRITGIDGWFSSSSFGGRNLVYSIHADSPSGPGSVVDSEIVIAPDTPTVAPFAAWARGFGNGATVLGAGNYWASFTVDPNDPMRCGCFMPAFNTISVPVGAFQNGFTGVSWSVRDLSLGFRLFGDSVAGVPEPSSWAMMIIGFGAAGSVLRRNRRTVTAPG